MEVIIQNVMEARQAVSSARALLRHLSVKKSHDPQSCGCGVCKAGRLLGEAVQEMGAVPTDELTIRP